MRIQARIFLVFSVLMAALVGVQVWLHVLQIRAVERSLGGVATAVGREMLTREIEVLRRLGVDEFKFDHGNAKERGSHQDLGEIKVEILGEDDLIPHRVLEKVVRWEQETEDLNAVVLTHDIELIDLSERDLSLEATHDIWFDGGVPERPNGKLETKVIFLRVEEDEHPGTRVLEISDGLGEATRIPIPTSPTMKILRENLRRGLVASGILLVVGLMASAFVARRLAKPLQHLAAKAEEVGRGSFGLRVPVTASGEVGELEESFDRMSQHLAALEKEREEWRRREHLAQLGDLSRGLAHTIRNPLHTLGLAVEELAENNNDKRVETAKNEIRKIDRWIRSFLALGAGTAAASERCDLVELVQECLLEVGTTGGRLRFEHRDEPIIIQAVAGGLRPALANLLENALQASPEGQEVEVFVDFDGLMARVEIRDNGPGIPAAVKDHLFEPHQTTRAGGAGMGLFLARQLIEEMHEGRLSLSDAEGGGTVAQVSIPMAEDPC